MKGSKGSMPVSVHGGLTERGNRVAMGVKLPSTSMNSGATRSNVPDVPSIGPRTA